MSGQTAVNAPCQRRGTDDNVCPLNSLANHVPSVEALKPGVLEVLEGAGESKKWFGAYLFSRRILERTRPTADPRNGHSLGRLRQRSPVS